MRRGWQWGFAIGLSSPKKAPGKLHVFENTYYAERINVVLTFSAEAIAELAGCLR